MTDAGRNGWSGRFRWRCNAPSPDLLQQERQLHLGRGAPGFILHSVIHSLTCALVHSFNHSHLVQMSLHTVHNLTSRIWRAGVVDSGDGESHHHVKRPSLCYNKNISFILEEVCLAWFCTQSIIVSHVRLCISSTAVFLQPQSSSSNVSSHSLQFDKQELKSMTSDYSRLNINMNCQLAHLMA